MSVTKEFSIDLSSSNVNAILSALHHHAGDLAAREARRTGGRGFASGGVSSQVAAAHETRALLLWARLRTQEWRRDPDGDDWFITGMDDLNYTLQNVQTKCHRRVAKQPTPRVQRNDKTTPDPWHEWEVVPMDEKDLTPPEGWDR